VSRGPVLAGVAAPGVALARAPGRGTAGGLWQPRHGSSTR